MRPLPDPVLVVLVGASAAGKTTWAGDHFAPSEVVSSDALRAIVGEAEDDLDASDDAFALLREIVERRLRRRLTTVVDALGLDPSLRAKLVEVAHDTGTAIVAVSFSSPLGDCLARNAQRDRPLPRRVIESQHRRWREMDPLLHDEGFDDVIRPEPVRVRRQVAESPPPPRGDAPARQKMQLGLMVSRFDEISDGAALAEVARQAEAAGFDSLWMMDHFRQIPQLGRAWEPMLDPFVALTHVAAATDRLRVGTLVASVTHRPPAILGSMVAALDRLSGGRVTCGLGAGWWRDEHRDFGLPFPDATERLDVLEDTIGYLRALWGAGGPPFGGKTFSMPSTSSYPRPIQDPVPIIVGGQGEKRTLRIAATLADGCNLFGDPAEVAHKVDVVRRHAGARDLSAFDFTHLDDALIAHDRRSLADLVERTRGRTSPSAHAERINAGLVADHLERIRSYAAVGVTTMILSLPTLHPDAFAAVPDLIEAATRF